MGGVTPAAAVRGSGRRAGQGRFVPLSPRVAVLIVAAIVLGLLLWMARDSVRPFIVGLLFVYLLDPPVRWLARRGVRRSIAILIVYVVAIVAFVEFLALTLTPLVNEILRFIADFPKLAADLDAQLQRLGEFYARLQIPVADPRLDRQRHRRHRRGRGRRWRTRPELPPAAPDRRRELPRARSSAT